MTVPSFPLLPPRPAPAPPPRPAGRPGMRRRHRHRHRRGGSFCVTDFPLVVCFVFSFTPSVTFLSSAGFGCHRLLVSVSDFPGGSRGPWCEPVPLPLCRTFPQTRLRGAPHAASPSCPRFWPRGPQRRHARPLTPAGQSLSSWGPWAGHVCCCLVREMRPHRAFRADELADRCPALRAGEQGPGAWHGTSGTSSRGDGHMGLLTWDRGALGGFGVPEGAEAGGGAPSVTAGTPKEAGEGKGIPLPVHTRRCLPGSRQPGARGTVRDIPVSCTDRLLLR